MSDHWPGNIVRAQTQLRQVIQAILDQLHLSISRPILDDVSLSLYLLLILLPPWALVYLVQSIWARVWNASARKSKDTPTEDTVAAAVKPDNYPPSNLEWGTERPITSVYWKHAMPYLSYTTRRHSSYICYCVVFYVYIRFIDKVIHPLYLSLDRVVEKWWKMIETPAVRRCHPEQFIRDRLIRERLAQRRLVMDGKQADATSANTANEKKARATHLPHPFTAIPFHLRFRCILHSAMDIILECSHHAMTYISYSLSSADMIILYIHIRGIVFVFRLVRRVVARLRRLLRRVGYGKDRYGCITSSSVADRMLTLLFRSGRSFT